MHLLTCLACGEKTDKGLNIAKKLRPLCGPDVRAWDASGEGRRAYEQGKVLLEGVRDSTARAFMDWLNRVQAEHRVRRAA